MKNAVLLCLLLYTSLLSGQSPDCPLPTDIWCNDQIYVTLDPIDGTYPLTLQMMAEGLDGVDPCVLGQLRVSPSFASCANAGTTAFYELIHSPVDGPETPLCWGTFVAEDKTPHTITSCPTSPLYISLEPNTQLTLTPADLGVTATDNCTVTLTTNPDPFVITSNDNGNTLTVDVIATDPSGHTSTCTVSVNVSVDNCATGAAAPENLAVALVDPDLVFSWDAVPGATNYAISLEYYMINKRGKGKWKAASGLPPTVSTNTISIPLASLDGATLHRFTVAVSGGGNNCTAVIEFVPDNLAGASGRPLPPGTTTTQIAAQGFQVFPNPVSRQLQFTIQAPAETPAQARVYNLHGQLLLTQSLSLSRGLNEGYLEVNDFQDGLYLLEVRLGKERVQQRFVVQQ